MHEFMSSEKVKPPPGTPKFIFNKATSLPKIEKGINPFIEKPLVDDKVLSRNLTEG